MAEKQTHLGRDARRAMIARAAQALIFEQGLGALRTRAVAARAGINISTLHFHVAGKSELIALAAETVRDDFLALLPPAPDPSRPARAMLRAEASAYEASLRDRPELAACYAEISQAGEAEEILSRFAEDWLARWVAILEIGRAQGVFRADLAPLPAALAITGALTAFGHRGGRGRGGDRLAMFRPVFEELERGVLAAPVGEGEGR